MVLRTRFRRYERGLTLIEVLVAATILALALLGLAPMFTGAVRSNASANQLTNANTLAREKLEELSGYPRNNAKLPVANGRERRGADVHDQSPGRPLRSMPPATTTCPTGSTPGRGPFPQPVTSFARDRVVFVSLHPDLHRRAVRRRSHDAYHRSRGVRRQARHGDRAPHAGSFPGAAPNDPVPIPEGARCDINDPGSEASRSSR